MSGITVHLTTHTVTLLGWFAVSLVPMSFFIAV